MRNMSFSHTVPQIRDGTKTVTRRVGWGFLKPGDRLMACEKCQGLKKGETVKRIRVIEVVSVRVEPIYEVIGGDMVTGADRYDHRETAREGVPELSVAEFGELLQKITGGHLFTPVTRIEFKYVE